MLYLCGYMCVFVKGEYIQDKPFHLVFNILASLRLKQKLLFYADTYTQKWGHT